MRSTSGLASVLPFVLALSAAASATSSASAQQDVCPPYGTLTNPVCQLHYGTPVGPGGLTPPEDSPKSRCWYSNCQIELLPTMLSFPLNLSMGFGPGMGDYPPKTLDPVGDTLAVVGVEGSYHARPVPSATRSTLGGVIDLMTGVPLLQESDFELSYGSATFRHIRTYSELPSTYQHENACTLGQWRHSSEATRRPDDVFWDWHGQGWMMSANPILLIDAAYEGVSYPTATRKCYLIIDAHRAIPFTFIPSIGQYEAPARFDAILEHNGTWLNGAWDTPPTEFTIWLQKQSVKYVFETAREDMASEQGVSYHTVPNPRSLSAPGNSQSPFVEGSVTQGPGIPYYGLLTRIEDRSGNTAVMEYCPVSVIPAPAPHVTGQCHECRQQCGRKGRLSTVKLYAAGRTTPTWTIVYIGRDFDWRFGSLGGFFAPYETDEAIHAVYVYKGEVSTPNCAVATLSHTVFQDALSAAPNAPAPGQPWLLEHLKEGLRQLDSVDAEVVLGLDPDWTYRVKYLYAEPSVLFSSPEIQPLFAGETPMWEPGSGSPPRLLKTTVHRRVPGANGQTLHAGLVRETLYRYRQTGLATASEGGTPWDKITLSAVWDQRALDAVHAAATERGTQADEELLEHWPLGMLALPEDEAVPLRGPENLEGVSPIEDRALVETASYRFERWGSTQFGTFQSYINDENPNIRREIVQGCLKKDPNGVVALRDGVFTFVDRSGGGRDGRVFKIYRFWNLEASIRPELPSGSTAGHAMMPGSEFGFGAGSPHAYMPHRGVARDPFFFHSVSPAAVSPIPESALIPLSEPFWVTVIDEYGSLHDATFGANHTYADLSDILDTVGDRKPPRTRRMVLMNAAGHVLNEQEWNLETGNWASTGMFQQFKYDSTGRLIEHRTYGWGQAEQHGDPTAEGLVNRYSYGPENAARAAAMAVGVQKGVPTSGTPEVAWIRQSISHPSRKELPLYDISFRRPVTELVWDLGSNPYGAYHGGLADITRHEYEFASNEPQARMVWKKSIGPASPREPGGPHFYPFQCEVYDDKGNVVCRAYGSVLNPSQIGQAGDVLFVDALTYDEHGKLLTETIDAPSSPTGSVLSFTRYPSAAGALEHETEYAYDTSGRVKRITYPNGRSDLFTERIVDNELERRKYELVWVDEEGQLWAPLPGTMTRQPMGCGSVGNMVQAQWVPITIQGLTNPPDPEVMELGGLIPLAMLLPGYNSSGQLSEMTVQGADGTSLSASVEYSYLGEILRERAPDGTVTRRVHDPLGRLERVFRGTADRHPYWGTVGPSGPTNDNMVIVEGRRYGTGVEDARLLKEVITFRDVDLEDGRQTTIPSGGSTVRHWYDWRMRDVLVEQEDEAPATNALTWNATYLDNLGRVRLSATFGSVRPTGVADPTGLGFGAWEPTADAIRDAAEENLLRLSETIYNARGQVEEQRQYDPGTGQGQDPMKYLSTRTYYDYAGRPVFIQSPNGSVQRFEYDAKGRQTVSRLLAGLEEITRTETEFDTDGNALVVTVWERTHDGTGEVLDENNSVRLRTFNWYDEANRLIATAELGADLTGTGDSFVNQAGTALERPADAPTPGVNQTTGLIEVNLQGLPASAKVTCFTYDAAGRRYETVRHNAQGPTAVTRTEYTGLGQVKYQLEGANVADPSKWRATAYKYDGDRLLKIGALVDFLWHENWDESAGNQVTELVYNAEVVKPSHTSFTIPNYNNAWVSDVRFPDASTGLPSDNDVLSFMYFTDGRVASRTDQRGVKFKYSYDVPGNLTKIAVDNIAGTGQGGPVPADSIDLVEFGYDPLGNPLEVRAKANGGTEWVAHNEMGYDSRGNLLFDRQSHGAAATVNSPTVSYSWGFSGAAAGGGGDGHNFDRLVRMLYPKRVQAPTIQRELDLVYGASLAARDSLLGRVTRIDDNRLGEAARYAYAGTSRRVSQQYGFDVGSETAPVNQTYADTSQSPVVGYPGLDPFGRVKDLHFKNPAGTNATLQRFEYGHDPLDQRVYARITQRSSTGTAIENERSYLYGYDRLGRLVSSQLGALDSTNTSVSVPGSLPAVRESVWTMDLLGNWVGDSQTSTPGRRTLGVPQTTGPPSREISFTDTVNRTNAVEQRVVVDGGSSSNLDPVHDAAGNLVLDADYFYQYDAWNRLVKVSAKGSLSGTWVEGTLQWEGTPGAWIVHYTYDGLGRLIRKQSPWPTLDPYGRPQVRTEHFYYDGVRRVQEVVTDPFSLSVEEDPISSDDEAELPPLATVSLTRREYVHSPGYVDEVVAQVDVSAAGGSSHGADRPAWVIQDANYNLVALVNDDGAMLHQYTWDPYGQPVQIDRYDTGSGAMAPFENRIGHQGLFFDRFDGAAQNVLLAQLWVDAATGLSAKGLYQNRNRSYSPGLGRFVQRDPNGTSSFVVGVEAAHGHRQASVLQRPSHESWRADGSNAYSYLRACPVSQRDALGLFTQKDGYAVEAAVQQIYLRDHPGQFVVFGNRPTPLLFDKLPNSLKPDILNFSLKTWLEIKPLSPSGIVKAGYQGAAYATILAGFDIHPESSWSPSQDVFLANGRPFKIMNVGGIIFYTDIEDTLEDVAVVSVAALAYNAKRMGATSLGRMVLGGLLKAGGANGVLGGVLASQMAQLESSEATATFNASFGVY